MSIDLHDLTRRHASLAMLTMVAAGGFAGEGGATATAAQPEGGVATGFPVVRVSILRSAPDNFERLSQMMVEAERPLAGIRELRGLIDFWAGADPATKSLSNVSVWTTLEDAKQMDGFQPMLDLAKTFAAAGATFERPIMNYATLWRLGPAG